jgi:hypothetical protein
MSCRTCNGAGKVTIQGQAFSCMDCPPNQGDAVYDVLALSVVDRLRQHCQTVAAWPPVVSPFAGWPVINEILGMETSDLVNRVSGGQVINGRTTFLYIGKGRNEFFTIRFDQDSFTVDAN